MNRISILCFFFVLTALSSSAQKLEYQLNLYGFGDNREYQSGVANSQTMMGTHTSFQLGTTLEDHQQIRFGLDQLFEFGSEINEKKPKLIAYYHYTNDSKKEFYFGSFPRMELLKDYPYALLTDTLNYYRPNIEGLYGKYGWNWGHESGFLDWTSRQTMTRRETFLAGLSGEINYHSFFVQHYITLFHYAGTADEKIGDQVEDNFGAVVYLGSHLEKLIPIQKAYIKMGMLESTFRNRAGDDELHNAFSFTGQFYGETKNFALRATWNVGQKHYLMNGDWFYRAHSYVRGDFYWKMITAKCVQVRFNLSYHLVNGKDLDSQQQLSLVYKFGGTVQ